MNEYCFAFIKEKKIDLVDYK